MLTGPQVILLLKCAVGLVTILLIASGIALVKRKYRLHGLINTWMASLTLITVMGFIISVVIAGLTFGGTTVTLTATPAAGSTRFRFRRCRKARMAPSISFRSRRWPTEQCGTIILMTGSSLSKRSSN